MKLDGNKAITCPLCLTRVKGTSGKYTKEYRNVMYAEHLGRKHPETGIIAT